MIILCFVKCGRWNNFGIHRSDPANKRRRIFSHLGIGQDGIRSRLRRAGPVPRLSYEPGAWVFVYYAGRGIHDYGRAGRRCCVDMDFRRGAVRAGARRQSEVGRYSQNGAVDMRNICIFLISVSLAIVISGGCKKKNKDGYVYLMTDNTNLFKIGFSKNPNDRLYQFQTGNPKISMYANYPANKLDEKLLHKLFKKKRDCREWFNLKPKDLKWIDNYFNNQNQ